MSESPERAPEALDAVARTKTFADAASSVIAAVTGAATVVGLIWVVLEAFFLPDGLPRLDGASFAALASAIAVAAVLIVAFCSTAVGAAGFAFRGWRREKLERYWGPFHAETRVETAQFATLCAATVGVVIAASIWTDMPGWMILAIPALATFVAVGLTVEMDPNRKPNPWQDATMIYASLLSSVVWFPAVLVLTVLTLGSAGATGNKAVDVAIYVVFLVGAAAANYFAAVARPRLAVIMGIAITVIAGVLNPPMLLGAPFRALRLADTTVHFPAPSLESDRKTFELLIESCDPRVVEHFRDGSYEVFVRQRIGLDWTVNCDVHGGTVTFGRTLVTGTIPVASPTPMPVKAAR